MNELRTETYQFEAVSENGETELMVAEIEHHIERSLTGIEESRGRASLRTIGGKPIHVAAGKLINSENGVTYTTEDKRIREEFLT
ncbi:hypothetical protein R5M92_01610 [Halomonas sp. Bachu 37]|uniref:hypothetical protein n=1 Tax=Halomonas kashgarensis TaxID=3084920 RepID=UPI003217C797